MIPALFVKQGKYSVAEPIFVDERRPVLVARKLRRGAQAGDLVLLNVKESNRSLRGEVARLIGPSSDPRNVYDALFASIETSRTFREKVEDEAREVAKQPFGERRDLRDLPTVTIDGDDAKDFDDAISIELTEAGYRLHVHIADVTHYLQPGTPMDRQARFRGNSVYLPGTVAPMLPESLSNGICSLRPDEERAAVTVEMDVTESGEVRGFESYRSLIKSDARLTYNAVDAFIEGRGEINQPDLIRTAHELSKRLKVNAARRGKLELGGKEPEYEVGDDGIPVASHVRTSTEARDLIEELMVLTNECVAKRLEEIGRGVFRVHERPDAEAMDLLKVRLAAIGMQAEPTPEDLGTIVHMAKSDAVRYMVLRSLPRAHYSTQPNGHFGLALEDYTHFTSPIRRYADVLVHRALLGEEEPDDLSEVAEHISGREYRSMICERTADDYTLMWLMRDRISEEFRGMIVSVASFGLFVELETGATGLVHASKLPGWWELEENGVVFSNDEIGASYRVGDRVLVELLDISPLRRRAELKVIKRIQE